MLAIGVTRSNLQYSMSRFFQESPNGSIFLDEPLRIPKIQKIVPGKKKKTEISILIILNVEISSSSPKRNREKRMYIPSIAISSSILDTRSGRILGKGEFMENGSAKGYLLTNKQRQDTFALAQKLAQRLIAIIDINGA